MGKHKGDRKYRGVRMAPYIDEALGEAAEKAGLNYNDFIVNAIAAACGLAKPFAERPTLDPTLELTLQRAS